MTQTEKPLYLKQSPIYNKIMQLAIAIVLIIIAMSLLVSNDFKSSEVIRQHTNTLGGEFVKQAADAVAILSDKKLSDKKDREKLQAYIEKLAENPIIIDVHFYSPTGQLLVSSKDARSIRSLYGIAPNQKNDSNKVLSFVHDVKGENLLGYLRFTVDKATFRESLTQSSNSTEELIRLLLLIAGVTGFFLTRGLNRFSRQGIRIAAN